MCLLYFAKEFMFRRKKPRWVESIVEETEFKETQDESAGSVTPITDEHLTSVLD